MDIEEHQIPLMIRFIFKEQAAAGYASASERLLRWSRAFDHWLEFRYKKSKERSVQAQKLAWREFFNLCLKMPWEITGDDVQAYLDILAARGLEIISIRARLTMLSSFYKWCQSRGIDLQCGVDFDPARSIEWPKHITYTNTHILSDAEVRALLAVMKSEGSILSKRDYAFTLMWLLMGHLHKHIFKLQWKHFTIKKGDMWIVLLVRKRKWHKLPKEVWEAIRLYLEAAGRWEGMQAEEYIFVPLANALTRGATGKAEDWLTDRPVNDGTLLKHIKRFGRMVGIPDYRVHFQSLRHTGAMLLYDSGETLEKIMEYLNNSNREKTRRNLETLARMREVEERDKLEGTQKGRSAKRNLRWERGRHEMKKGEVVKHGLNTKSLDQAEIDAIMAEGIEGLDQEIAALEQLNEALFQKLEQVTDLTLRMDMAQTYAASTSRLNRMRKDNQPGLRDQAVGWLEDMQQVGRQLAARELLAEHDLQELRQGLKIKSGRGVEHTFSGLKGDIARVRFLLRRARERLLCLSDPADLNMLVKKYGEIGGRLQQLLKLHASLGTDLEQMRDTAIQEAIAEVRDEV
jgi:site-specific recombinase XerD